MSREALEAVTVLAEHVQQVCTSLTPEEWVLPSGCAGWSVGDLVAHLSSNLKEVADPSPAPAEAPDPPLLAEQAMDYLVDVRRPWTQEQVLAELTTYAGPWLATLAALQDEPAASSPVTLSELGTYPAHQLADAFAFDVWCHLTADLLAPGGPVDRPAPEATDELVRPAVGWMLAGLPQMCGVSLTMLDEPIALRLTGPGGGDWLVSRTADGTVEVTEGKTDDCVIESDARDFVRWGTKRTDGSQACRLSGDTARAQRFLDALNII